MFNDLIGRDSQVRWGIPEEKQRKERFGKYKVLPAIKLTWLSVLFLISSSLIPMQALL